MALTVRQLLELPVLQRARPEVLAGSDHQLDQTVRWVHTSEIYDISPLLKGGEVLLTTGLGLVGVGTVATERYAASLAGIGVAAIFLELGRTFAVAPAGLVEAARRVGLVVVALHGIVPFIEVTEIAHPLISAAEFDDLRAGVTATDELLAGMIAGEGLPGLVARLATLIEADLVVVAPGGDQIAGTTSLEPGISTSITIGHGGSHFAALLVAGEPSAHQRAVIDRAVPLLAVEVQRSTSSGRGRDEAGAELLGDIVAGRYGAAAEVARRAAGIGLVVAPGHRASALCVLVTGGSRSRPTIVAAARTAARRVFGTSVVSPDDDGVLVGLSARPREFRAAVEEFTSVMRCELASTTGDRFVVGAGPLVDDLAGLARSAPLARDTALMARRLTPEAEVAFADDFALYQLLSRLVDDEALERFVHDQIGALIDHDARTGAELVRTLDTYLANGLSKSAAAGALGVRRQTLYSRLDRIGGLLGVPLDSLDTMHRERRTAIDLALVSWRLRTSAATRA